MTQCQCRREPQTDCFFAALIVLLAASMFGTAIFELAFRPWKPPAVQQGFLR